MERGKVFHIGRITDEIVDSWAKMFRKGEDGYFCKKCGGQIMQTTCRVSIHDKLFSSCAGSGEVRSINYPYCPKCDGKIEYITACYHC